MPTPDRTIVRALKRIDTALSATFAEPPGRWAIWHDLWLENTFDGSVAEMARELYYQAVTSGYAPSMADCELTAVEAIKARSLVFFVVNEDGSYRPLDHRVIQKLQRMDYLRRNCGLRDWRSMMDARADALRRSRQMAQGDIWDCIRRDPVFKRQASDILWGGRPTRSIIVPEGVPHANDHQRVQSADPGEGAGTQAECVRGGGDGVAVPQPPDPPA